MASSSVVSARLAKRLETVQQQLQDAQQQHLRATHAAQKQLQALEVQTDNLCTVYERFRETLEAALKANPHPAVQAAFAAMTRNWRQALTLVDGSASAVESGSDEEEGNSELADAPESTDQQTDSSSSSILRVSDAEEDRTSEITFELLGAENEDDTPIVRGRPEPEDDLCDVSVERE